MRYSPHAKTTTQPTNRAQNEPAMDKNANFGIGLDNMYYICSYLLQAAMRAMFFPIKGNVQRKALTNSAFMYSMAGLSVKGVSPPTVLPSAITITISAPKSLLRTICLLLAQSISKEYEAIDLAYLKLVCPTNKMPKGIIP